MARFVGERIECVRGERLVLENVSFSADDSQALVLTGPNGSGKSTLLRLMAGLMRSSAGPVMWDDTDIFEDVGAHHARTVYVGHADAVKPTLSVMENVAFWYQAAGSGGTKPADALDAFGISRLSDLPARYLSAGQRRRVNLCRALTSGAKLWLLDEPTTALDAKTSADLGEIIAGHRASGGIAVISTHTDLGLTDPIGLDLGGIL